MRRSALRQDDSGLLALPTDCLMRVVCCVRHDELQPLLGTCRLLRQAASAAIAVHFNYMTPEPELERKMAWNVLLKSPPPHYFAAALRIAGHGGRGAGAKNHNWPKVRTRLMGNKPPSEQQQLPLAADSERRNLEALAAAAMPPPPPHTSKASQPQSTPSAPSSSSTPRDLEPTTSSAVAFPGINGTGGRYGRGGGGAGGGLQIQSETNDNNITTWPATAMAVGGTDATGFGGGGGGSGGLITSSSSFIDAGAGGGVASDGDPRHGGMQCGAEQDDAPGGAEDAVMGGGGGGGELGVSTTEEGVLSRALSFNAVDLLD